MGMRNCIGHVKLRELALQARLRDTIPTEGLEDFFSAVQDAISAAEEAKDDDEPVQAEDLAEAIKEIAKARLDAEQEKDEAEKEHEKAIEELEQEHAEEVHAEKVKRIEAERALDEMRTRAEENLARSVRDGHEIDQIATAATKKLQEDLKVEKEYSAALLAEANELRAENEKLKSAADRLLAFERQRLLDEVRAQVVADLEREEKSEVAEARRERDRLRALLATMAGATPESALRAARIAVGQHLLEQTGTLVREGYIPSRRERRREKTAGNKR